MLETREAGQTVFLSSHDLPEVERVCDRVGIIRDGRLITVEDIGSLKTRAARVLEIHFTAPVPADAFTGLPGVRDVEVHGDVMRCTVVGPMDGIVKAAARFRCRRPHEPRTDPGGHLPGVLRVRSGADDVTITVKTLRDQRRALIGWSIGVAALVLLYASFYPSIKANAAQLDKSFESLPDALRNAIGTGSISSPVGYLRSELFSTMGPLLLLILAIGAGARAIAGEEEAKTLIPPREPGEPPYRRPAEVLGDGRRDDGRGLGAGGGDRRLRSGVRLHIALIDVAAASVSAIALAVSFGSIALAIGCGAAVVPSRSRRRRAWRSSPIC